MENNIHITKKMHLQILITLVSLHNKINNKILMLQIYNFKYKK